MPKKEKKKKKSSWFSWGRSADIEDLEAVAAAGAEVGENMAASSSSTVTLTESSLASKDTPLSQGTPPASPQSSASNTPRKHRPHNVR